MTKVTLFPETSKRFTFFYYIILSFKRFYVSLCAEKKVRTP